MAIGIFGIMGVIMVLFMIGLKKANKASREIESCPLGKRDWTGWKMSRRAKSIFIPVFFIAFINFSFFIAVNECIGGDAINGYMKDGHYFSGSHGAYTEVSKAVWTYSYYHTVSMWVSHSLVFILAAIFMMTGEMVPVKKT